MEVQLASLARPAEDRLTERLPSAGAAVSVLLRQTGADAGGDLMHGSVSQACRSSPSKEDAYQNSAFNFVG